MHYLPLFFKAFPLHIVGKIFNYNCSYFFSFAKINAGIDIIKVPCTTFHCFSKRFQCIASLVTMFHGGFGRLVFFGVKEYFLSGIIMNRIRAFEDKLKRNTFCVYATVRTLYLSPFFFRAPECLAVRLVFLFVSVL